MNENEKIFPILRKLDYLWSKDLSRNLCDVFKELNGGKFEYKTDLELEQQLKNVNPDEK